MSKRIIFNNDVVLEMHNVISCIWLLCIVSQVWSPGRLSANDPLKKHYTYKWPVGENVWLCVLN